MESMCKIPDGKPLHYRAVYHKFLHKLTTTLPQLYTQGLDLVYKIVGKAGLVPTLYVYSMPVLPNAQRLSVRTHLLRTKRLSTLQGA